MEITFSTRGICHYADVNIGSMRNLEEQGYGYQLKMLCENEIPCLLRAQVMCEDGEVCLSFNTQGYHLLANVIQQKKMDGVFLEKVVRQLVECTKELEDYLLCASNLELTLSSMFWNPSKEEIGLLYVPGKDSTFEQNLQKLFEEMMPLFDYRDRIGTERLYELHRLVSEESVHLASAYEMVISNSDNMAYKEEKNQSMKATDIAVEQVQDIHRQKSEVEDESVDTLVSKRTILYAICAGAALVLIIKYLFFEGTTATAIFGIAWLLALIVLLIMTTRDVSQEDDAMREYQMAQSVPVEPKEMVTEYTPLPKPDKLTDEHRLVPLMNGAMPPLVIPRDTTRTIGRDKQVDYRVTTTQISRVHAKLSMQENGLYVQDLGSTNGTFVNSNLIPAHKPYALKSGDVVRFADEEFFVS